MINIIKPGFLNTWEFANSDEYLKPHDFLTWSELSRNRLLQCSCFT